MKTKTQQFQRLAEIAEHITVAFLLHFWPIFEYCGQDLVKVATVQPTSVNCPSPEARHGRNADDDTAREVIPQTQKSRRPHRRGTGDVKYGGSRLQQSHPTTTIGLKTLLDHNMLCSEKASRHKENPPKRANAARDRGQPSGLPMHVDRVVPYRGWRQTRSYK